MTTHTPTSPQRGAAIVARVMRTPHMLTSEKMLGTSVSPAPRMAPDATSDAAKSGSANASMRSTVTPSSCTATSGVSMAMIGGAATYMSTPMMAMTPMPSRVERRENDRATSLRSAPTAWPTSVVAAAPMPKPGM